MSPIAEPTPAAAVTCPICGQELVTRRNKATGQDFLGRSGWPRCTYGENLPGSDRKWKQAPRGWLRLRFLVLHRDGYRCQLCGHGVDDGVKLHVDHKVPKARGGTDAMDNLWTLCRDCNVGKRLDEA